MSLQEYGLSLHCSNAIRITVDETGSAVIVFFTRGTTQNSIFEALAPCYRNREAFSQRGRMLIASSAEAHIHEGLCKEVGVTRSRGAMNKRHYGFLTFSCKLHSPSPQSPISL